LHPSEHKFSTARYEEYGGIISIIDGMNFKEAFEKEKTETPFGADASD